MIATACCFSNVAVGMSPSIDDAAYVVAMAEALMYWDDGGLPTGWRCLVYGCILGGMHRGRTLDGVGFASSRQRTFRLLRRCSLEQRANLPASAAILGRRGLRKAMQQGGCCGDVLAGLGEVRKDPIVGEDPLVYGTGRGARAPVSAAFNLAIDVRVLPDEPLPGLIDLLLMGPQLLHP